MKKISYGELIEAMRKFNNDNGITTKGNDKKIYGVIVFTEDSFKEVYPLESRSYKFSSDNKAFISGMGGYSIFASSLDETDTFVRLDAYIGDWKIDYCYLCD